MAAERKYVNWRRTVVELVEAEEAVAVITIDNPPLNLLTLDVRRELDDCVKEIGDDPGVRAVVITGAGDRAFSAGSDIREFPRTRGEGRKRSRLEHTVFDRIDRLPKPTLAAINGYALGGGLELALACDLRVAAENAVLGLPEVKIGVFPAGGGTQRLPRVVGEAKAKELMFFGEPITAAQALEIGLINRLAPPGGALALAIDMAREIAKRPAMAIRAIKEATNYARDHSLEGGLELEAELIDEVFVSHDAQEGVAAFLAKRRPVFQHR